VAYTGYVQGKVAAGRGDLPHAEAHLRESLEITRQMKSNLMVAWNLNELADVAFLQGRFDTTAPMLSEAEAIFEELGDRLGLANIAIKQGREAQRRACFDDARALYEKALSIGLELGNDLVIGSCLAGFAGIVGAQGHLSEAAILFGCAQDLLRETSTSLQQVNMTMGIEAGRAALGDEAWDAAWLRGTKMYPHETLEIFRRL
jgi:hypothetical protein